MPVPSLFGRSGGSSGHVALAVTGLFVLVVTNGSEFEYPLHPWEEHRSEFSFTPVRDVREQILERYDRVERRWKTGSPVISPDTSSPPISASPERGPYAERRDFALNLQPGAPPFWAPNGEILQPVLDGTFPANGDFGGNFCDEGALDDTCVLHQTLSFPGNYTISGRGIVPFKRAVHCGCAEAGCSCDVVIDDFLPSFASLSWATLTLEVERGNVEHETSLVQASFADGVLVQGQCNPPPSCHPESAPAGSCMERCGDFHACFEQLDVTAPARDGSLRVQVRAGHVAHGGGVCGGGLLRGRVTLQGEYTADGTLDVRGGGGLVCSVPGCVLRVEHFRSVRLRAGSVVAADTVEVRVPLIEAAGRLQAAALRLRAAALTVLPSAALHTSDPRRPSRADIHVRPAAVPAPAESLPGCSATCSPCTCLQVRGLIWFSRVVITGRSLRVGPGGHVSADRLGHLAALGPGAGESTLHGGGGGGFGGRGTPACGAGGGGGGGGYGLAVAPSDLGYCVTGAREERAGEGGAGNSSQAGAEQRCWGRSNEEDLGSGGGHGLVEGGQGGGAIRIHTELEVVVEGGGRVSADGEHSACVVVEEEMWAPARRHALHPDRDPELGAGGQRVRVPVSRAGGGAGSGGSVWVSTGRLEGRGTLSAAGGSATRACDTVRAVTGGGAGGGGRVALDYLASTWELAVEARGGVAGCGAGGAGTVYDSHRRLLVVDNGAADRASAEVGGPGVLDRWPRVVAGLTPWTNASAHAAAMRSRRCWTGWAEDGAANGGAFACEGGQGDGGAGAGGSESSLVERVRASRGGVLEFPKAAVKEAVVTEGGGLMATPTSSLLHVAGDVTVESGGVLGCYSCAGSVEAGSGLVGCAGECPGWRVEANGSVLVKAAGAMLGVTMHVLCGGAGVVEEGGVVMASDWGANSSVRWEAGGGLRVSGRVHVSAAALSGASLHVTPTGWVGADGLGSHQAEGPGAGNSSTQGGGGGGHGGAGAEACYSFAGAGDAYGSAVMPLQYGSGGGAGGAAEAAGRWANESGGGVVGRRGPVWVELAEGVEAVEVERSAREVRASGRACRLRGSRTVAVGREGVVEEAVPLSAHGTACPAGHRGSSLRLWCCQGPACDCLLAPTNAQPGGRGGGAVHLRATGTHGVVVVDGEVSARGEGVGCLRSSAPMRATGGGGAGGSVLVVAGQVEGRGLLSAEGGSVSGDCAVTKSGGGGAGGRVAVRSARLVGAGLRAEAAGGISDGCAYGGAGTVYVEVNRSLRVEGRPAPALAALTPYPPEAAPPAVESVAVRGAASLELPTAAVDEVWAGAGGLLAATAGSGRLEARVVGVEAGGAVGCLACALAVDAQNSLPGCGESHSHPEVALGPVHCPPVHVHADHLSVAPGGELSGVEVTLEVEEVLDVAEGAALLTSDPAASSQLQVVAGGGGGRGLVRVGGLVRFSTMEVAGAEVWVRGGAWVSADALGWQGGQGPGAGSSHWLGGGGGGYGGHGAQGCGLGGAGGAGYEEANASKPWAMGSGGGNGGGNGAAVGGRGGGRVRVTASGNVTVDGVVSADGAATGCYGEGRAHAGGGGSGGAVVVEGAGAVYGRGAVLARGGTGGKGCQRAWPGGGGGGGRIVLESGAGEVRVGSNASGGESGGGAEQADGGAGGGCAAGGAGTVVVRRGGSVSVLIDNGVEGRQAAPTWYPETRGEVQAMVVTRGAALLFPRDGAPPDHLQRALVRASGAVVAWEGGRRWEAAAVEVGRGGVVGCLECSESVAAGNGLAGCSGTCAGLEVAAGNMTVAGGGRVMGVNLSVSVSGALVVEDGGGLCSSHWRADSALHAALGALTLRGFVRFSALALRVSGALHLHPAAAISASALGWAGDQGPGAGGGSDFGGGGGGHAGAGDVACGKSVTGEVKGAAGERYSLAMLEGLESAGYGSGGGRGNATVGPGEGGRFSHPEGGHLPCFMDAACDEGGAGGGPGGAELLPVWEVARETGGGGRVRSSGGLCWPRGQRVEGWATATVRSAVAAAAHARACPAGWRGAPSSPDYCCRGEGLAPLPDAGWAAGGWWCDCSTLESGPNPGGRGGGRVLVVGEGEVRLDGEVSADGEATAHWVPYSNPGGGGAGGTVQVEAAVVTGTGRVTARGGGSSGGGGGTLAGGGGGGGRVELAHELLEASVTVGVEGGRSDCPDARIGRRCERVQRGVCEYGGLGDEFDGVDLDNSGWRWSAEPPADCTQAAIENTLVDKLRITRSNPHQGRCWDVSMSRLGWLRIRPSPRLQMWEEASAHRLHFELAGRTPFDVETSMALANNDSACVTAGLFASGRLLPAPHNASGAAGGEEFVSVGLLDYGVDAKLQWATRGTPMQEVFGVRGRGGVTGVHLRLVRDGDGAMRGYWKLEADRPWNAMGPAVVWGLEAVRVGLYAANCGEVGNASVDFDFFRDNVNASWGRSIAPAGAAGLVHERRRPAPISVTVRPPPPAPATHAAAASNSSAASAGDSSSTAANSSQASAAGNATSANNAASNATDAASNATFAANATVNGTVAGISTGGSRRLLSNATLASNATNGTADNTTNANVTSPADVSSTNVTAPGNLTLSQLNATAANASTARGNASHEAGGGSGNASNATSAGAGGETEVEVTGLQAALDATAAAGGGRAGGVSTVRVEAGEYGGGGLDVRGQAYVVLRGNLSGAAFTAAWHNTSSAHFVTSERFVETPGAFHLDRYWNGSAWLPSYTVFHVSIRPNAARTRYVFFVDGAEAPPLRLLRPAVKAAPHSYIFRLDPDTFNASRLPPLHASNASNASDGAGLVHGFGITTGPDAGLDQGFFPGTRNNGAHTGQVEFRVGAVAPDRLYYGSTAAGGMGGVLEVADPLVSYAALQRSRRRLLARPGPAQTFRGRLAAFYRQHNPDKLPHLDDMTAAWADKEEQLNQMLRAKYGDQLQPHTDHAEDDEDQDEEGGAGERGKAQLRADLRGGREHESEGGGALPGGASGARWASSVTVAGEEETIVPPAPVVIDCGGGALVAGDASVQLVVVDLHIDIRRCTLPAPATPGARAITIQHSIVRLVECEVVGGAGALDVSASLVDVRRSRIHAAHAPDQNGAALRIGQPRWRVGGERRGAGSQATMHRRAAQVYVGGSEVSGCTARAGGGVAVERGTWYCHDCRVQGNTAERGGGGVWVGGHGAGVVSYSVLEGNVGSLGGALLLEGGSTTLARSRLLGNAARRKGGAICVLPATARNTFAGEAGERAHSSVGAALVVVLDSVIANNSAVGTTAEPASGGAVALEGGGAVWVERSRLEGNRAEGDDSEGGGVAVRDAGQVYARDSEIVGSRAGYGGALRVRTEGVGAASVVLDNVTVALNVAGRFGAALALHAHRGVLRASFLFRAGRYYYNVDPDAFRARPLLRFGFNADPYLNPYSAGLAPHGTAIKAANPYEDPHHTLELPPDPRLTDQWPFFATGQRHPAYLDPRTTAGQKAASGGVAFLLASAGSGLVATAPHDDYDGVVAFKDCNVHSNEADAQAACYWHAGLQQHNCLPQTRLL